MSIVDHDYPPDVPVSVVLDCSPPTETEAQALALIEEGVDLFRRGELASAGEKIAQAQALVATPSAPRVQVVPLTPDEIEQRDTDAALAAKAEATATAEADRRAALTAKLANGSASPTEVQTALATLMGVPPT